MAGSSDGIPGSGLPQERLAQFFLDNASVCFFSLNAAGQILYANRLACRSLGYTLTELTSLTVFDIDTRVAREAWPEIWERLCLEKSGTFEGQHRCKDGTVFPIEISVTLIEFEGQRYSMALTKDITRRKRLLESLQVAQFVFEKAPLGIFLIKDGGVITNTNEHCSTYLGYSKEELRGMQVLDIDCGYAQPELDEIWNRQQRKRGLDTFETVHRAKDGREIPVEINGIMLEFNDHPYSVSFVKDISERKAAEAQRRHVEAQMREVQKMESLGTLAGGIAHDFNNILSAILGYAELAKMVAPSGSDYLKYVSEIAGAGNRAKELVRQILLFSRQGRGEKGPIDVRRVVNEALKMMKATLPANIEFIVSGPADLPPVLANEIHLHQIMVNLCTNAYHAMKATGGRLTVSMNETVLATGDAPSFPEMQPGKYLRLSVSDTGCGIPPELQSRIFDPYFTTKPMGEGTGLGLSTLHGIVKQHGGMVKVYSEVGVGTTFQVFLPVAESQAEQAAEVVTHLPGGSESILLVDDEKALLDIGRDLLERLGYRVETRASSIDAIAAFAVNPRKYDMVISDMNMPKMAGDEMIRQMRAIRPDLPVILCSGFSERIDVQAEVLGVEKVLMKPVILAELAYAVREVLGKGSAKYAVLARDGGK